MKHIYSFIFLLCLSLSGCDYLDTEPGDVISSDHFGKRQTQPLWSNIVTPTTPSS